MYVYLKHLLESLHTKGDEKYNLNSSDSKIDNDDDWDDDDDEDDDENAHHANDDDDDSDDGEEDNEYNQ